MVDMSFTDGGSSLLINSICQNLRSPVSKIKLKRYICSPNDTIDAKTNDTTSD